MKKLNTLIGILALLNASLGFAGGMEDDPLLTKVMGKIEINNSDNSRSWNINAWLGKDLDKFWIKSEGEMVDGETSESELQLLYSTAISPFWDIQLGARKDFDAQFPRNWGVVTAKGLTPYLFEMDASLFVRNAKKIALRLDTEYEYMLSQQLVLSPEIELNLHSQDDEFVGIGKGLSDVSVGVTLQYEMAREFAPYLGFNWSKKYGNTAKFANNEGEDAENAHAVAGIRFWF